MISLLDYYNILANHDWYYDMSDDMRVYREGCVEESKLLKIACESPEHLELYKGFKKHYFSGNPWDTEQSPLPKRPSGDVEEDKSEF